MSSHTLILSILHPYFQNCIYHTDFSNQSVHSSQAMRSALFFLWQILSLLWSKVTFRFFFFLLYINHCLSLLNIFAFLCLTLGHWANGTQGDWDTRIPGYRNTEKLRHRENGTPGRQDNVVIFTFQFGFK